MTQEKSLRDEIARLNEEVSRLKSEKPATSAKSRTRASSNEKVSSDTEFETAESISADDRDKSEAKSIEGLTKELTALMDDAEGQISTHPMTAVLGAFALGIVVGAILRR